MAHLDLHVLPDDIAERFWSKVDIRGPDECWEWQGAVDGNGAKGGYGYLAMRFLHLGLDRNRQTRKVRAHRLAWWLHTGERPEDDMSIRHVVCANRLCCNPHHLAIGTHEDNMWDVANDGSQAGENNPRAKLTWDDVHFIRGHEHTDVICRELAKQFSLTTTSIKNIWTRKTWKC